ncbi:hypothetical protein JCM8097_009059 [Rhodosporidiobolus ruineniae]
MLDTRTVTSWKSAYLLSFFPDSPVESYFSSSVPAALDSSTASSTLEALTDREGHSTDPSSPSTSLQSDDKTFIGGGQGGGGAAPDGANGDDERLEPPRKRLRLDLRSIKSDQHWLQTAAPSADLPRRPSRSPHPPVQHAQTSYFSTSTDVQPPATTSAPLPDVWWTSEPLPDQSAPSTNSIAVNALHPSLRNLTIGHFRRILLDEPIESAHSSAFFLTFIAFLGAALPFEE